MAESEQVPARNGHVLQKVLSSRELEVLAMTSDGCTNSETAKRLGVTVHAVKFHLASVYRKLGVTNRTEAAVAFLRSGSETAQFGEES